jgi:antitoxin (DNA-binding transcriptional repressor) of toxin-antitoxin stability system
MSTTIGLKDLRLNVERYAKAVEKGESFIVMRRSKPLFVINPIGGEGWEEVIDFTKIRKGGIDVRDLLKRL